MKAETLMAVAWPTGFITSSITEIEPFRDVTKVTYY